MKVTNLIFLFIFMTLGTSFMIAQDIVDVPWTPETAIGGINNFIMGDTTATGERVNPNRIYRLERGKMYFQNRKMKIDFNLSIIADDGDSKPPMIARSVLPNGDYPRPMIEIIADSVTVTFKNLIIQGVNPDGIITAQSNEWLRAKTDAFKLISTNCVYNGWNWQLFNVQGTKNSSFILKDNRFRNGVALDGKHSGYVLALYNGVEQDTIIMTNNTFINITACAATVEDYAKRFEFVHNTVYGTYNGFAVASANGLNILIADNLYYNYQMLGADTLWHNTKDYSIAHAIEIDGRKLAQLGLKGNGDRHLVYTNNLYGWDQIVKDTWNTDFVQRDTTTGDVIKKVGKLFPIPWMDNATKVLFNKYKNFVDTDNIELDPKFNPCKFKDFILDKGIKWVKDWWTYSKFYSGFESRVFGEQDELFNLPWPLPEDLTYTDQTALTHARGGFPVGDLNWFPDKKKEWEKWTGVKDITNNKALPSDYSLSQNYPNPFNPTTEIQFSIPLSGYTTLEVYNVLGQKVQTLVSKELKAGSYSYKFDATNLTSGIYFYRLQSDDFYQVRKMMLIK